MTPDQWLTAGGLAVAALALLLNYLASRHARAESYRAALYSAQLDATFELLGAAGEFHHIGLAMSRGGAEWTHLVEEELGTAVIAVDLARSAGAAVLPDGITTAVITDVRSVLDAVFPSVTPNLSPQDRHDRVNEAWLALVATSRRELGAAKLGKDVRNLIGVTAREQLEQRRIQAAAFYDAELGSYRLRPEAERASGDKSPQT